MHSSITQPFTALTLSGNIKGILMDLAFNDVAPAITKVSPLGNTS